MGGASDNPQLIVAGRPLTAFASWGDLEVTDRWPFGCWEISWKMPLKPWQQFSWMVSDAPVEVRVGALVRAVGNLSAPDWDSGSFVAKGVARQVEEAVALDGTGKTTTSVNTALDQAFARGVVVGSRPATFGGTGFNNTETDSLNYIGALLDAWAGLNGERWYANAQREFRHAPDPTTPTSMITPDVGLMGTSDLGQAGTVYGRYVSSTTGALDTAQYPASAVRPEVLADWTNLGLMTSAAATTLCQSVWSQMQGQTGWTNGLELSYGQLRTMGDSARSLWDCVAGVMVRQMASRDVRSSTLLNTDFIVGESIWRPEQKKLQLNPVGLDPKSPGEIIQGLGGVQTS